ncbi:fumarylacetoacetate hydrolase family protein [Paenibacillus spongiae]|uniref:Fumarylacetoacetate hydrolase family protein n=1 Tax=Paenibacillus spongiae TaxID=2909671 RepID=A0ABY5S6L8_9BACL|nr:fumarylacetoacetate hydrolase family protein [Paenibacillus spongiae]UVI29309.1 fumarylacetoacetate hydrolase family protein [Paenibacillus spongiae]
MKLTMLHIEGDEKAAIVTDRGCVLLESVNEAGEGQWETRLDELLRSERVDELNDWYRSSGSVQLQSMPAISREAAQYAPLYRHPRKIWGIGMNYVEKAEELASTPPDMEPVCFMKPDTSLIGPGEAIRLPAISERVTAESEIGIIIGKTCKAVTEEEAPGIVAGYTPTLDMTAQDIHAKNPRFLGRSKCFDTFFSFGPHLVTVDEFDDLNGITVQTGLNGRVTHSNTVANMIYRPFFIVSYFSQMMTLLPGDIIMTGTPGSVLLREGDIAEARISGFEPLFNPVAKE